MTSPVASGMHRNVMRSDRPDAGCGPRGRASRAARCRAPPPGATGSLRRPRVQGRSAYPQPGCSGHPAAGRRSRFGWVPPRSAERRSPRLGPGSGRHTSRPRSGSSPHRTGAGFCSRRRPLEGARPPTALRAGHRRRSRRPAVRARRREPILPTRVIPMGTCFADPDLEPSLLRLGRGLRTPGRSRRDDRPNRSPRRRPHPQRR